MADDSGPIQFNLPVDEGDPIDENTINAALQPDSMDQYNPEFTKKLSSVLATSSSLDQATADVVVVVGNKTQGVDGKKI